MPVRTLERALRPAESAAMRAGISTLFAVGAGLALGAADPAAAQIYRWVDSEGRTHFTQELARVPAAQRDAARSGEASRPQLNRVEGREAAPPSDRRERTRLECTPGRVCARPGILAGPGTAARADSSDERIRGQDEASWRRGYREIQGRIDLLEQQIASYEQAGADHSPGHRRENVSRRNFERYLSRHAAYERAQRDLETARQQLVTYEETARRAGVPPGWLR